MFLDLRKIISLILLAVIVNFTNYKLSFATETKETEEKKGIFKTISKTFGEVWESKIYDLYIPVNTWHNRAMYDEAKTRKYNENPWGIGIGKTKISDKNNLHQLYIMEFQDSHNKVEINIGYTFLKRWSFDSKKNFNIGIGATAGLAFRVDFSAPLVLPILSLSYKNIAVETTYIPGGYNSLNVLFTWVRLSYKF